MASSQRDQKEQVRLLAIQHGIPEAARIAKVKQDTIYKWNMRYKWGLATHHGPNGHVQIVQSVPEALHAEIAENEKQTRLSLSRYAKNAAKDSESASLRESPFVHKAAQVAGIAFKWGADDSKGQNFTLNVLNMGDLEVQVGAPKPQE